MVRSGTVTILFTDLVGSTELLIALGEDRFDSIRDEHDGLVAGAVRAGGGTIVKDTGDGYMAVFDAATDAFGAAIDAQQQIAARNASAQVQLGVRIGISAGDAMQRADDYHGVAAVEAARLCAIATGGQILASETARRLAGSRGQHDFIVLGELDLKGLPPLAAVAVRWAPDAPVEGPVRALGNLPLSLDRFIGRDRDLEAVGVLLREHRLVTLTGPGGSGKTRLALEVGRALAGENPDGAWLVDLASIGDERLVAEATVGALGLRSSGDPTDALKAHLGRRSALVVFDNCEHVLESAAPFVSHLLEACPEIRVLATSREPLRVPGEAEYDVNPLPIAEAEELLLERVPVTRSLAEDPRAIARICEAVDGLPLAIELAAGRLRVLSPAQVADRLDDQLTLLTQGGRARPDRQKTLRATLDWSHDLLDDNERIVFRRLAVFAGSFSLDAALEVVVDQAIKSERAVEVIEQLVARSFVMVVGDPIGRSLRLLEPIRQYALERLHEADEQAGAGSRHLAWVARFARQIGRDFLATQSDSTALIHREHANVCRALEFAFESDDAVAAARIVDSLAYPWFTIGQPDASHWCEARSPRSLLDVPAMSRAGALVAVAILLENELDYDRAQILLLEARDLYRDAGSGIREGWTLIWLSRAALATRGPGQLPREWFEDALRRFREAGVAAGVGYCVAVLADEARRRGDHELARDHAEEAVRIGRSERIDLVLSEGLEILALLDADMGDFDAAEARLTEDIAIHEASGDLMQLVGARIVAAEVAVQQAAVNRAASHVLAAADLVRAVSSRARAFDIVAAAALVLFSAGRNADSAVLVGAFEVSYSDRSFGPYELYRSVLTIGNEHDLEAELAAGRALALDDAVDRARAMLSELLSSSREA